MSTSDESQLTKALREVESAKIGLDHEVGTLLSPDGQVIREYTGEAHGINIPAEDQPLFAGNIFTHNHPGGRTLTVEDIIAFADSGAVEVRASSPQGTYFSLRATGDEVNRTIGRVMREENVQSYEQAAQAIRERAGIESFDLSYEDFMKMVFDQVADQVDKWLIENAEEFGYTYTEGVL